MPPVAPESSRPRWARPVRMVRWLTTAGMALAFGMLVLGALVLVDSRRDAWVQAEQAASNLVVALERDIARNIAMVDLSLQGVIAALQQPGLEEATPEIRHMALFDRAATAEYLGAVVVIDAQGNVTASSNALTTERMNVGDRDYFGVHREQPNAGLHVSHPFRSRLRNRDPTIAISRRLPSADGRFHGVAAAALRLAYFQDLFNRLDVGSKGSVSLLRTDGPLIARHPFADSDLGRNLSDAELFRRLVSAPSGQFVATARLDGVTRFFTFRRIGSLPLVISIGLSVEEIYAPWWRKAQAIGSILLVLCGAIALLALLFRREMLARIAAEGALTEAAEKLAVMAATDGLTGLANRRHFDLRLEEEWRRAVRNRAPLSLLLLDADFFKAYNDGYGHQEGDQVLMSIAACIRMTVRRPADAGARYGGEEFAVLLPETDAAGARKLAEMIRGAVEALGIPHAGSPMERVTVSVGWATASPQHGQPASLLVEEADRALYEAKRNGRNRVADARLANLAAPSGPPGPPGSLHVAA